MISLGSLEKLIVDEVQKAFLKSKFIHTFQSTQWLHSQKLLPNEFDTNLYGCKHSVQIGATTYALNPASYATVENMFLNAYNPNATIYKSIRYRLTGNDGTVVCGG